MTTKASAKKIEDLFEPVIEFNNMLAKAAETTFNMQIASFQAYSKLGIENMNQALKIRSVDEMTAFAEAQKDMAKKVSDMIASDAKAFAEMSTKFYDNAKTMAEGNVKTTVAAATEVMKAA
jgi:phasin family protein